MLTSQALTEIQFSGRSSAYANSAGHANRNALDALLDLVKAHGHERMLDIATGGGHVAHAFRPHVARVVAYDLVPDMLNQARRDGVRSVRGMAERLPFENGSFELVTCRLAPHHFADVDAFLRESHRVLAPGGKLLVVDTTVPEDPVVAEEIERIEKLRDPSHGRNLPPSEWRRRIASARFALRHVSTAPFGDGLRMEFDDWTRRIGTPEWNLAPLREAFQTASPALAEALRLQIADTITFELDEVVLLGEKIWSA